MGGCGWGVFTNILCIIDFVFLLVLVVFEMFGSILALKGHVKIRIAGTLQILPKDFFLSYIYGVGRKGGTNY